MNRCQLGTATFRTDNPSVIAIIRDTVMQEATARNVPIRISTAIGDESVHHMLQLLEPLFDYHHTLAAQAQSIAPLKELIAHERNSDFLTSEQQYVVQHAEEITAAYELEPFHVTRLHGIVERLFVDFHAFKVCTGAFLRSK